MSRLKPGEGYQHRRDRRRGSRRRQRRKETRILLTREGFARNEVVTAKLVAGKLPIRRAT